MRIWWALAQVNETVVEGARWPLWLAICLALVFCVIALVVIGLDDGIPPDELALGYEYAWDRLDFDAIWAMSTPELRQDRSRDRFVADKRQAIKAGHPTGTLSHVELSPVQQQRYRVLYRSTLHLIDGSTFNNEILVVRHPGSWLVAEYHSQLTATQAIDGDDGETSELFAPSSPSPTPAASTSTPSADSHRGSISGSVHGAAVPSPIVGPHNAPLD